VPIGRSKGTGCRLTPISPALRVCQHILLPAGAAVDDLQLGDRPGGIDQERQILSATDGLSVCAANLRRGRATGNLGASLVDAAVQITINFPNVP